MANGLETYQPQTLTAEQALALPGWTLLNFGANDCHFCQAAAPLVERLLFVYPQTAHVGIADGKGQRLGRHYQVKLWPTLILLKQGQEVARVVRPIGADALLSVFAPHLTGEA